MAVVYSKTPKGHTEIDTRSGGLSPKVRRILIFIDGKKSLDDLRAMTGGGEEFVQTMEMLERDGYIEATGMSAASPATASAPSASPPASATAPQTTAGLPPLTVFKPVVEQMSDPTKLAKARNFMLNTLNVFVGALGTSALLNRIESASDHEGLRANFEDWYHAIAASRDGRKEAPTLRIRLLEVI